MQNLSKKQNTNVFRPEMNWGKMSRMTSLLESDSESDRYAAQSQN